MNICSFCFNRSDRENRVITGPGVTICESCIKEASNIIIASDVKRQEKTYADQLKDLPVQELLSGLEEIHSGVQIAQERLVAWVAELRKRDVSWAKIAEILGVTRQTAWEKFASATRASR
ncbi:ClpX C4-type zinc finger protein [Glutamicibacter ardleyensis]|uniref:ClpX C4-type zinc finger protein n=1 Tax=Glutamicibacter ardleyensis TaxID=225894 RepID=UPI003FD12CA9